MRISIKPSAALIAALAILISSAVDVSAQGRRDAVVIEVTVPEDSCRYQVRSVSGDTLSKAEQDLFFMEPGGFLNVIATGTAARFRIEDDTTKKVKGFQKKGTADLNAGESAFLHVRGKRLKDPGSQHRISVHCCTSFNSDGACVNPVEADSFTRVESAGSQINRASLIPLDGILRLFDDETPGGPLGPGGPDMDVHP